ncbi:MAG: amidohydrolase family protein [Streptosporangiaceae bacterium]
MLDAFGPSRVMFGSDWPVCLLATSYAGVVSAARELTAELNPDAQAQVFGGTAARVYGLPETGPRESAWPTGNADWTSTSRLRPRSSSRSTRRRHLTRLPSFAPRYAAR